MLLNQFHDIIPGSSIREVYEDSEAQYRALLRRGEAQQTAFIRQLAVGNKFGYDIHDGVMRLSPFKRGTYPNEDADQGVHTMRCCLLLSHRPT